MVFLCNTIPIAILCTKVDTDIKKSSL